ncbi:4-hydroxyproline epimerase [Kiloniella sp. b19]|uniref:4-hydroxyproline epimerase n=1 Tax=Kiloniella sp. GXU_MW_B19 TaxID=3141326 RepID=UPI0031DCA159
MIRVIDSHTEGEPTRVIVEGGPDLGEGTVAERALRLEQEHSAFCQSVLLEPRGHDAMVGALLVEPSRPDCVAGVVYFNPVGNLGMCGHATIGLAVTLGFMGRIKEGQHRIETPVGVVEITLHADNSVSVVNVESYRLHRDVQVDVEGYGVVTGDVAWGGNWFFLTDDRPCALKLSELTRLTAFSLSVRKALEKAGITGRDGAWIDHVELLSSAHSEDADARNFVLCPGGAYDRSPCGTGCSAKMACLAEDGKLDAGVEWVQESVIDSCYRLSYQPGERGGVIPTVTGRAFVTAEASLLFHDADPYARGITA